MRVLCAFPEAMPSSNSRPPSCLAPVALFLALLLHLSLSSQAGDRRPLPVDRAPGLKEKTLILLDVSTKNPVRTVNENFLSLQLDPSIIHDGWLDFLSSKRLVTLARGLSPAFLRFGGKRTDFLQFQNLRNPAKSRGGLEPNNYRTMHGRAVNGSQLGKDYIQLKSLLQPIRIYSRASLYGPNIGRPRKNVIALLDGFMKVAGSTVDAVTWQHCYIDGRVVKVMDFLKTRLLDTLSDQIRKIQKVVNTYTPGKKIWLEGVVTTSAGGTNNLSDSYAAGFLWLNTLGMLANQGIDVVIRHSFFDHGYNHLVDQNFNPLPDYWLSLLYKRLIGPKVLAVHVAGLQRKPRPGRVIRDKLRIYAHCTNHHNHNYVRGSITLFIINLHRSRKKIKLAGTLRDKLVHQYLLQPYGQEGLKSKSVQLNGQPLVMVDDGTLPELKPRPLRAGRTLVIPPVTMGFYVVKNVNALACRYR
uniref:Heparanase 2 (inactive) n=1 Tax=Panthera tigris altaica TaxID=74533 RepID=A0A8C9JVC6_PANTA